MALARIFFAGVGGQGTLTVTNLLAKLALDKGIEVVAGEIHGMAQRGGVVHTFVLLGGYKSPKIEKGEADFILGFEPLETLRALPFLKPGEGIVVSSATPLYPLGVALGKESYPSLAEIKEKTLHCAKKAYFWDVVKGAKELGVPQTANTILLAAFLSLGFISLDIEDLKEGIKNYLKPKIVEINLKAVKLGVELAKCTI